MIKKALIFLASMLWILFSDNVSHAKPIENFIGNFEVFQNPRLLMRISPAHFFSVSMHNHMPEKCGPNSSGLKKSLEHHLQSNGYQLETEEKHSLFTLHLELYGGYHTTEHCIYSYDIGLLLNSMRHTKYHKDIIEKYDILDGTYLIKVSGVVHSDGKVDIANLENNIIEATSFMFTKLKEFQNDYLIYRNK